MKSRNFLLNTNSKKIHDLKYLDGRCKISDMKESFKIYFNTLEEAMEYPSKENQLGEMCSICEKNGMKSKLNKN